jgi:tRNA (cytidine/uridine-2'-O-)-methyltransferase
VTGHAGLAVALDIIEPLGFVWRPQEVRRVALDYGEAARVTRHASWDAFRAAAGGRRLVLLTTKADRAYVDFRFDADDILLLGRESAGVPDDVHAAAGARLCVPMTPPARSLNVIVCAAMVLGEALRQTRWRREEP